jgi:hypothetical protein
MATFERVLKCIAVRDASLKPVGRGMRRECGKLRRVVAVPEPATKLGGRGIVGG